MKIAVIADIHSNFRALEAVAEHIDRWQADQVIVAGDVVNRGPMPLPCFQFVKTKQQSKKWEVLRGNHEDYVLEHLTVKRDIKGVEFEIYRMSHWTFAQLGETVTELSKLPFHLTQPAPNGSEIRITHASMRHIRDSMILDAPETLLMSQIGLPLPGLFCSGHTHLPFVRKLHNTCVVNVGSVGMPFDRDIRAGYAQLTWHNGEWQAKIVRVEYDRAAARRDFYESGYLDEAGALSPLVFDEFEKGCSHLFRWNENYRAPVMRGEISLEESVKAHLKSHGVY